MYRTVHVRTVFPSGPQATRTVLCSRSGSGAAARSFFFLLRAAEGEAHARALEDLLAEGSTTDPAALAAAIDAVIGELPNPDLALILVEPPHAHIHLRGGGAAALFQRGEARLSERRWPGMRPLAMREEGNGRTLTTEISVGDAFLLGVAEEMARFTPDELSSVPGLLGRSSRAHPTERRLSALSESGGALILGRVHHLPAVDAVDSPPERTRSRSPLRAANVAALAAAVALFVALVEAGPTGRAGLPVRAEASWSRTVAPVIHGPAVWTGDLLALVDGGNAPALALLDPVTGITIERWPLESLQGPLAPIRVGGRIAVPDRSGTLVGLDIGSGVEVWRAELGGEATASTVMDERLWIGAAGRLHRLDAASGEVRWSKPMTDGGITGVEVTRGVGVVTTADGRLVAFAPGNGRRLWQVDLGGERPFEPRIVRARVTVATESGRVGCYHVHRGQRLWERSTETTPSTPPERWGETVLFGTTDGVVVALDAVDGEPKWRAKIGNRPVVQLVVEGESAYVVDGATITSLDPENGRRRQSIRHGRGWEWSTRTHDHWIGGNRSGEISAVTPVAAYRPGGEHAAG